jgi:hypothetical protein
LILNLISKLDFPFRGLRESRRIGRTCTRDIVFLEQHPRNPVARARNRFAARIVPWNSLQVHERVVTVTARQL